MKNIILLLFLTLGTISSYAQTIIDGLWFVTTNEAARSQCESGNNDYEISVCFTGSDSFEGTISFSFDPAKFTLTDAGAFSLVSPGNLKLENITAYLHSPKCYSFRGKKTVLSPLFSCSLVGTSHFNLPYSAQTSIATPLFVSINGGSGTNISQFYPPNGTQLLAPQDAALQPQYIRFNGKIIIDNNYTFYDDSEIAMEQNAQIEIADNKTMTVKLGVVIYPTCITESWDKISVGNGSTLDLGGAFFNRIRIEGANNAVFLKSTSTLKANHVDFRNNNIGIKAPGSPNGVTTSTNITMIGCHYSATPTSLFAQPIGLDVKDLPFTTIPIIFGGSNVFTNRFDNLYMAIKSDHSSLFIDRAWIADTKYGINAFNNSSITVAGFGQSSNIITNGLRAMFITNSDLDVNNTGISDFKEGIVHYQIFGSETEISKNSITTKSGTLILSGRDNTTASIKENILTQSGGFPSATVRLGEFIGGGPYSTNEWSFTKNKITGFGNTSTFYAANFERLQIYNQNEIKHSSGLKPGIRIDGGYQNKVQCNKSIEGKTGVLFNGSYLSRIDCNDLIKGSDAAVQILGNCEKTRIRGNTLNGTYTDLKYGEATAGYSYTGPQEYHRNLFLGSHTSDYNAINYESSVILALKSQFLVKTGMHNPCPDIDGLMPLFSSAAIDWFKQPTFGIPYPCPFSCPSSPCVVVEGLVGGGGNEVGNTDIDIRNGIVNSGVFADAINWTTQKRLYKRLTEENNQSVDYQIFLANQHTKSMGAFTNFEQSIGNLTRWSPSELVALEQLRAQRRILKNTLTSTTPYTFVGNDIVTDAAVLQQYAALVTNIRVLDEQINGMKALKKSQLLSNIPTLETQNNAITTDSGYELNQKLANELLLKRLTSWDFSWDASDKNTLMAIAAQCPLSGGDAVFQARAMLIGEDDLPTWEDAQTCAVTKVEGRSDNLLQQRLTVFPNPAQQYIIIQLPELPIATTTGNITVFMYDLQGKTVAEFQFPANQTLLYLDLANLPKGIYMGKVNRDGHPFETFKVLLEE